MSGSKRLRHYVHTLRHLKPWQVIGRVVAPVRQWQAVQQVPRPPKRLKSAVEPETAFLEHDPWNTRENMRRGCFSFLNTSADLGWPVDWEAASMPLLWRFNLHYFHYLHLLEPGEQEALCREWVAANPIGQGVGWHSYPTALRIVNWCRADLTAPDLLESLYQQAAYLYRNLETHVCGNHLLENARALVLAGQYLRGQGEADDWFARGIEIYQEETEEQILGDGFHFERSPMYHALMLEGALDVINVLSTDHPACSWLEPTARRMADALAGVTHPDGTLALFNDSTQEIAPPPAQLLNYAERVLEYEPRAPLHFPDAGYYVYRDDAAWLMVDAGAAGPNYLMAHAHADVFSYELSLYGQRFVVDAGVYEYAPGSMRQYVRSTAAHNTVEVDGTDQIECWNSFRVARRSTPHNVIWTRNDAGASFEGTFDGYGSLVGDGITHRRWVEINSENRRIEVHDAITGENKHIVESRIHLHPEVDVRREENVFYLKRDGTQCCIEVDEGPVRREKGWYCPRFGVRHQNCTLVIGERTSLPVQLTYRIQY